MRPYIGVTGFMLQAEVKMVVEEFLSAGPYAVKDYMLMVGLLVSHKTLTGGTNRFPARYPKIKDVGELCFNSPYVLNLVHFNTHNKHFGEELIRIMELAGRDLNGFQLNISWPDPNEIYKARNHDPLTHIVVQVGGEAFKKVDNNPKQLAERLREYIDLADYVLLDPSGGTGQPMNVSTTREYLSEIYSQGLHQRLGTGIAGGLYSENIGMIEPLAREFKNLSIDAEGRLRIPSTDQMNIVEVRKFIRVSKKLLIGNIICDGCNVREPHEHRCHGQGPIMVQGDRQDIACECEPCNNHPSSEKLQAWADAGYPTNFEF